MDLQATLFIQRLSLITTSCLCVPPYLSWWVSIADEPAGWKSIRQNSLLTNWGNIYFLHGIADILQGVAPRKTSARANVSNYSIWGVGGEISGRAWFFSTRRCHTHPWVQYMCLKGMTGEVCRNALQSCAKKSHRMADVGRDIKAHPVPMHCCAQCCHSPCHALVQVGSIDLHLLHCNHCSLIWGLSTGRGNEDLKILILIRMSKVHGPA